MASVPALVPTLGRPRTAAFFAPSGYLPEPAVVQGATAYLAARGWQVAVAEGVGERYQRFAGTDERRLADLQRWAGDPTVDVAIAARGGYGLSRLLDRIDYAAIGAAGRVVVGYSDFTAFNLALLARAGGVSFQGPSAADFARGAEEEFTVGQFFAALSQEEHSVEFETGETRPELAALDVRGRLWGGNLSMVCALLGTPYFPRVRGGILFLEDVNEPAYRIERLFLQLLQAGVIGRQKAVLLGDFSSMPVLPTDNGYDLAAVWAALRARCAVPLVGGLPLGHARHRATLAVGAAARLAVRADPAQAAGATRVRLQFKGHPTFCEVAEPDQERAAPADRKIGA